MHPVIVGCLVATAIGAGLALRWGHLPIEAPWHRTPEQDPPTTGVLLRRFTWFAALFVYGVVVSGLLVVGPGGRLVMRLLAVTAGDAAQGAVTEAREIVGVISVGGTVGFIAFAGLFGGTLIGLTSLAVRRWVPAGRLGALVSGTIFAVVFSTRLEPLRAANEDFGIVGPGWVAVATFLAVGALAFLTFAATAGRVSRLLPMIGWSPRRLLPYAPLVLLVPAVAVTAMVLVVALPSILLLSRPAVREAWARPEVTVGGRVVLAAITLAALPGFVSSVAKILSAS